MGNSTVQSIIMRRSCHFLEQHFTKCKIRFYNCKKELQPMPPTGETYHLLLLNKLFLARIDLAFLSRNQILAPILKRFFKLNLLQISNFNPILDTRDSFPFIFPPYLHNLKDIIDKLLTTHRPRLGLSCANGLTNFFAQHKSH